MSPWQVLEAREFSQAPRLAGGHNMLFVGDRQCHPTSTDWGVHVDPVRATLLAGINFEQVHAELMAALDGIAAGKGHCDFVEVPQVGTTIKIFDAVQRAVQFLHEPI